MVDLSSRVLRFDRFTLDLARYVVLKGDQELALRRQSFDVLRHLAERQGEVVSAGELVQALWATKPARPDDSVSQCIKDIRRALGDDARWIIRAVPGRGYTFMAGVTVIETPLPSPGPASDAPPTHAVRVAERRSELITLPPQRRRALIAASLLIVVLTAGGWLVRERLRPEPPAVLTMMAVPTLAVLPFAVPDDQPDLAGEARAFSDNVESEVAQHILGSMLSLSSAASWRGEATDLKAIGRQLGARYLLLGSLRRDGDQRSGNARLIESQTGRELLVRPFRYAPGEDSLQAVRMASAVSLLLTTIESRRPLPATPQAAHYAIIAFATMTNHRNPGAFKETLALFEKALRLDRDWVPALLGYGSAQYVLSRSEPPDRRTVRLDKAQDAVERAIKLAPLNASAFHFQALVLLARRDPVGAIAANQHALRFNPHLPNAHAHLGLSKISAGLAHEAIAHIEEALRLAPAHRWHSIWCLWAGQAAVHTAHYDAAIEWLQKATYAKVPRRRVKPWLAVAYAGLGREEEGRALIAQHLRKGRKLSIAGWGKRHPRVGGVLADQRARIEGLLRRLGVPEGKTQTGAVQ